MDNTCVVQKWRLPLSKGSNKVVVSPSADDRNRPNFLNAQGPEIQKSQLLYSSQNTWASTDMSVHFVSMLGLGKFSDVSSVEKEVIETTVQFSNEVTARNTSIILMLERNCNFSAV
jgi:hypothetical protein